MTKGEEAVLRARGLIGTRFVAQGRDARRGLDCVGLALLSYDVDVATVPDDYRLNGMYRAAILDFATGGFRRVARTRRRTGDLLVLQPGARQFHLGVWSGGSLIHADILLRRVVERPGAPDWPVVAVLRPRVRVAKGN